jgi:hypothetical protein
LSQSNAKSDIFGEYSPLVAKAVNRVDGAVSIRAMPLRAMPIRAMPIPQVRDYVKVADAARILGVSPGTVRVWAETGKSSVPRNPANGYRLFKRFELEAFLADVDKPALPTKPK